MQTGVFPITFSSFKKLLKWVFYANCECLIQQTLLLYIFNLKRRTPVLLNCQSRQKIRPPRLVGAANHSNIAVAINRVMIAITVIKADDPSPRPALELIRRPDPFLQAVKLKVDK